MAVDGTWITSANTPLGPMKGKIVMVSKDNVLSGTSTSKFGADNFDGGKVEGDNFEFTVESKLPMGRMKISYKGKVEGDKISGMTSTMGIRTPFTGTRETAPGT